MLKIRRMYVVTNLESSAASVIRDNKLVNSTIVVAVSGGLDSMTLLHVLLSLRTTLSLTLIVAHANHGLRGSESDADEQFVRNIADAHGLPFYSTTLNVLLQAQQTGSGIEAAARKLRYDYLIHVASLTGARAVAVAHHANDAAESFLLHLARGSGIHGLASHAPVRDLTNHILLVRPLHGVIKTEIQQYAVSNTLQWRTDSSNTNRQFLRNEIRHTLIPALTSVFGSDICTRISRSAGLLREANEIVQRTTHDLVSKTVVDDNTYRIPIVMTEALGQAQTHEVFRAVIATLTGNVPGYSTIQRVWGLVAAEPGHSVEISDMHSVWRDRDHLTFSKNIEHHETVVTITADGEYVLGKRTLLVQTKSHCKVTITPNPNIAYVNSNAIVFPLVWRTWKHGDRMVPFAKNTSVLVSDLLTNAHVPSSQKPYVHVVADAEGLLWICGVRPAERTRVHPTDESITIFTYL